DLHALVGQADLVGVGVHQCPADGDAALGLRAAVPLLDGRVELATDVLDRLLDRGQAWFEPREDGVRDGVEQLLRTGGGHAVCASVADRGKNASKRTPAPARSRNAE